MFFDTDDENKTNNFKDSSQKIKGLLRSYILTYDVFYIGEKNSDSADKIRNIIKKYVQNSQKYEQLGQTVFLLSRTEDQEEIYNDINNAVTNARFSLKSSAKHSDYAVNITIAQIAEKDHIPLLKKDICHKYHE
ncbi:hypothetical protein [Pelosinus sp. sgz500959]|uniref:hypothetical protein n=1 Tax=Pelosinus sp. sgz500959 TaxID=3242472 RepID=UPI0036731E84